MNKIIQNLNENKLLNETVKLTPFYEQNVKTCGQLNEKHQSIHTYHASSYNDVNMIEEINTTVSI